MFLHAKVLCVARIYVSEDVDIFGNIYSLMMHLSVNTSLYIAHSPGRKKNSNCFLQAESSIVGALSYVQASAGEETDEVQQ